MKIPKDSLTPTMITEGAQRSKAQNIHTIYYYKGLIKPQAAHPYGKIDWEYEKPSIDKYGLHMCYSDL
jgi:hypothetical protein